MRYIYMTAVAMDDVLLGTVAEVREKMAQALWESEKRSVPWANATWDARDLYYATVDKLMQAVGIRT